MYTTGDSVFYKRTNNKRWHGPGKVLGRDGQQILVKHGSTYVRVHSCRLMPDRTHQTTQRGEAPNKASYSNPTDDPTPVTNDTEDSENSDSEGDLTMQNEREAPLRAAVNRSPQPSQSSLSIPACIPADTPTTLYRTIPNSVVTENRNIQPTPEYIT